jgi:hypothetical protein
MVLHGSETKSLILSEQEQEAEEEYLDLRERK